MKLDLILRTHSTGNVHKGQERYVDAPKSEVMLRSVNSVVTSANAVGADIRLWVLDDHSDQASLAALRAVLARSKHPVELISLQQGGVHASALAHFDGGRTYGREVVYFIEDDYLHTPSAIGEMIDAYQFFKLKLGGREVALFPTDYPDRYVRDVPELCRVVYGPARHWRTVACTTNTVMMSKALLEKEWPLFETLARNYAPNGPVNEDNTINQVWRERATLFSPIPSLALHLQFEIHKDPYIDWKSWWDAAKY